MNFILTSRKYRIAKITIWAFYLSFLLFSLFKIQKNEILVGIFLSGVIIQLSVIRFINNWYYIGRPKLLDWFRLATFYAIIVDFFFIAFTLDRQEEILVNNRAYINSEYSLPALCVILIALLTLRLGEILIANLKPYLSSNEENIKEYSIKNLPLFYIILFSTIIVQIYMVLSGSLGYGSHSQILLSSYSFIVRIINIVISFYLVFLAVNYFKNGKFNWTGKISFYLLFFSQLLYGLLSGMKENIIVPVIILSSAYLMFHKKISYSIIGGFVVFLILLYPINNSYRDIINHTELSGIDAIQLSLVKTLENDIGDIIATGSEMYASRLTLFGSLMYSIQEEDNWDEYKNLNRYIFLPVSWILPRGLIPSKPASTTGTSLYEMQTGRRSSSITPSTYGWSYFEGGYIPVILTFFIFGVIVTIIEKNISLSHIFGIIIYIYMLINLVKIESDIYFRISDYFQTIFIYYLIYKILLKSK